MRKVFVLLVLVLSSCRVNYDVITYRTTPQPQNFYVPFYTSWGNVFWWNRTPIVVQQPRRWRTRTNIQRRRAEERTQSNRGRSNQRLRSTTPPPTHSNRNSSVRRSNTNIRKKNQ